MTEPAPYPTAGDYAHLVMSGYTVDAGDPELVASETAKYEKIWREEPVYSEVSPGYNLLPAFMRMMTPQPGQWLCDYGAGTGKASLWLHWYGLEVIMFDLTGAGLQTNTGFRLGHRLIIGSLTEPRDLYACTFDLGLCADVMEHIPTYLVDTVLHNIISRTDKTFFNISLAPDVRGDLHLTVRPFRWWLNKLKKYGHVRDARHLLNSGIYVVEQKGARAWPTTQLTGQKPTREMERALHSKGAAPSE